MTEVYRYVGMLGGLLFIMMNSWTITEGIPQEWGVRGLVFFSINGIWSMWMGAKLVEMPLGEEDEGTDEEAESVYFIRYRSVEMRYDD